MAQKISFVQNKITGVKEPIDFGLPGNVWQLKCKIAAAHPSSRLDGVDRGVGVWKRVKEGAEEDKIEDWAEELNPTFTYSFLLFPRMRFDLWKDMTEESMEVEVSRYNPIFRCHFQLSAMASSLREDWALDGFEEFVDAVFLQLKGQIQSMRHTEAVGDLLVDRNLQGCSAAKKRALVTHGRRSPVQEVVVWEDEDKFYLRGYRMAEFLW